MKFNKLKFNLTKFIFILIFTENVRESTCDTLLELKRAKLELERERLAVEKRMAAALERIADTLHPISPSTPSIPTNYNMKIFASYCRFLLNFK